MSLPDVVSREKEYVFEGPDWDAPCPGCSAGIHEHSRGVFDHLAVRDTTLPPRRPSRAPKPPA